jgi:CBS-domain-containing membrane protein
MSAMRLVPNVGTWRTPVSISPLGSSTVPIAIAGSDILPPASMISGSQVSYVVNQALS